MPLPAHAAARAPIEADPEVGELADALGDAVALVAIVHTEEVGRDPAPARGRCQPSQVATATESKHERRNPRVIHPNRD